MFKDKPISIKRVINKINKQATSDELQLEILQKAIEELKEKKKI